MQYIKNSVFLYLTPRQKAQLTSFLKSFAKKHANLKILDLIEKFIEDETYYKNVQNPHFEFVLELFEDEIFLSDLKKYFEYVFWELKQKEAQKPIIEKQKAIMKEQRKRAQEFKMKKLPPSKKQLYFYEKLCKAHNVEMKPISEASRLDLRNWIMEILEPPIEKEEND